MSTEEKLDLVLGLNIPPWKSVTPRARTLELQNCWRKLVTKLLKVKPFNPAVVPEFQLHDSAKGVAAYSVIPLSIVSEEGAKQEMIITGR